MTELISFVDLNGCQLIIISTFKQLDGSAMAYIMDDITFSCIALSFGPEVKRESSCHYGKGGHAERS